MNKKEMKQIAITKVIVKTLKSFRNFCDEWELNLDVDFILDTTQSFTIFNQTYFIDRIRMFSLFGEEIHFRLGNEHESFEDLEVSKIFVHKIYLMLEDLQSNGGKFEGYDFRESLMEILSYDYCSHCINTRDSSSSKKLCLVK